MKTVTQKRTALKTWLRAVSGFGVNNVLSRDSGGPRPVGNYIDFDPPVEYSRVGIPFLSGEDAAEGVITRGFSVTILAKSSVDFFGADGVEFFNKLELSASTFAGRSALAAGDLTYVRHTPPIFVPAYDDTDPRPRYRSDLFFYTQVDFVETDYEATEMTGSVELIKPDNTKMTEDLTVTEE